MSRNKRVCVAGNIFHVLNRANLKNKVYSQTIDYQEFIKIIIFSIKKFQIDIFAYVIMPNHWHIVCRAKQDGELSKWVAWLQILHTKKWHKRNNTVGSGHFYQGRFKSFLVQDDNYFLQVCMYVERNALRAGLVSTAEGWPWSSLSKNNSIPLTKWPIDKPENYLKIVNQGPDNETYLEKIRFSVNTDYPFGDDKWVDNTIMQNGFSVNGKRRGRPKNKDKINGS
jgi:putative transposase